jgi:hypothetical protein
VIDTGIKVGLAVLVLPVFAGVLDREAGAAPVSANVACAVLDSVRPLPSVARETSGFARSRRDPKLFWTHNDAGNSAVLYGVTNLGALAATVKVEGATMVDWEDIDSAPCRDGNCLFIGDIGDNDAKRASITVHALPEPAQGIGSARPVSLHARYPGGARDAEALFVLDGKIFIVTKGRTGPVELYRYPDGSSGNAVSTLSLVRELFPKPRSGSDLVTSAAVSPDGKWVGVRSYRTLFLYRTSEMTAPARAAAPLTFDLGSLREAKGEGLALADDGTVWLTSEGDKRRPPSWSRLKCSLPSVAR